MNMDHNVPAKVPELIEISGENYLSPEFLKLEAKNLWPRVWQVACREEEIPNAGDYIVYDVANETIVLVRRQDGGIDAFHNVCPHRGRQIMEGCGHATNFRCRYHNWTFGLNGKNILVQDKDDWQGALEQTRIDLHPVKTGTWGGFVWINPSPESESLEEFLTPLPEYLDPYELQSLRFRWSLELHIPANWKIALEAFMEGYHVAGTHPQLLANQGEDYSTSFAHGKHAHFGYFGATVPAGQPSPRLKRESPKDSRPGVVDFFRELEETFGAIFTDRDAEAAKGIMQALPEDADPVTSFVTAVELGRKAAEDDGTYYPPNLTYEAAARSGVGWNIFPNCVTLPYFDGAVWYRARPDGDDPGRCIFNIWSLKRYAPGKEPKAKTQVYKDITGKSFGLIVDQDVENMAMVQKGMRSSVFRYAHPNPVQEVEISNFHRVLEEYVLGKTRTSS
jgi:phenylpropionate dioxygenase-like ring-hydroxylating dioxygenase large terminal subunit